MSDVRVLVVDDQLPFRAAAQAVVESMEGFTVVATARSGEEALAVVASVPVDLVVMDVMMPGMGGVEAARAVATGPGAPVVVLVSTYESSDLGDGAVPGGAAAYLSKSAFDADELRAVWQGQLVRGQRQHQRDRRRARDPLTE